MDVKLQALEGTLRHVRVWMSTEQVGAKRQEHPHRIRFVIEDRPVDVACRNPSRECGTEGTLGKPERLLPLLFRQKLLPRDVRESRSSVGDVAAARAVTARQGIEQRDRSVRLRRSHALSDAVPGIVGDRRCRGQDLGCVAQSRCGHAGDLGYARRRIFCGRGRVNIEGSAAGNNRTASRDVDARLQLELPLGLGFPVGPDAVGGIIGQQLLAV